MKGDLQLSYPTLRDDRFPVNREDPNARKKRKERNRPQKRWHEVLTMRGGEPRTPYLELVSHLERATSSELRDLKNGWTRRFVNLE